MKPNLRTITGVLTALAVAEASAFAGEPRRLALSLTQAEELALSSSQRLQALEEEVTGADSRSKAQEALLWPRLTLDAQARYVSEIGSIKPSPMGPSIRLGDNWSYSVGPLLSWTAWDFGSTRAAWKSAEAQGRARRADLTAARSQQRLLVRNAYFRAQLLLEQLKQVGDALKLAQAQHRDIQNRSKAGAASRLDLLSAHREVLNLSLQHRQTQADLAVALRELLALVRPDAGNEISLAEGIRSETLRIELDPLDRAVSALRSSTLKTADSGDRHPQLQVLVQQREATLLGAESVSANLWPRLQLAAKTSLDYPNGPVLERINQNTLAMNLSMPLFEMSRTRSEADERRALARALEHRLEQARTDLRRDWGKAHDQLESIEDQLKIHEQAVSETEEVARLSYTSYQAGRTSFLEVQSANLRALDAKVQKARAQVQLLLQLAILAQLSEEIL